MDSTGNDPRAHKSCCLCSLNTKRLEECQELTKCYESLALLAVPNHRLSRFTRYPKDTSNWQGWDVRIGSSIKKQMKAGGDYRYANHHYHPLTVTSNGVLSTLDRKLHKDLIRRIYGSVSKDKEKVYVNVPILTVNEAQVFYIRRRRINYKLRRTQ